MLIQSTCNSSNLLCVKSTISNLHYNVLVCNTPILTHPLSQYAVHIVPQFYKHMHMNKRDTQTSPATVACIGCALKSAPEVLAITSRTMPAGAAGKAAAATRLYSMDSVTGLPGSATERNEEDFGLPSSNLPLRSPLLCVRVFGCFSGHLVNGFVGFEVVLEAEVWLLKEEVWLFSTLCCEIDGTDFAPITISKDHCTCIKTLLCIIHVLHLYIVHDRCTYNVHQ